MCTCQLFVHLVCSQASPGCSIGLACCEGCSWAQHTHEINASLTFSRLSLGISVALIMCHSSERVYQAGGVLVVCMPSIWKAHLSSFKRGKRRLRQPLGGLFKPAFVITKQICSYLSKEYKRFVTAEAGGSSLMS